MIYPKYLKPGDVIGVCAPSKSIEKEADALRFENGAAQLKKKGYDVIFTEHVFGPGDAFGRSSDGKTKADEFNGLVKDKNVSAIISASGGDFLAEMLPYIDKKAIRLNPKWVQGYSDNTSLLFYLTTKLDIATAYGANFGDFGMKPWQLSVKRNLDILEGKLKVQNSFSKYQNGFRPRESGFEGYSVDKKVKWKNICNKGKNLDNIKMKGRLIGGCMDVILNISGTPYDGTLDFIKKYKDDGIIWFLESFDLHFEEMMEGLWKMKEMGWFEHTKGIIFGRPLFYPTEDWDGNKIPSYADVLRERLSELKVPVILDVDIGHLGPQFVMINGALAKIVSENGKGSVTYL